MADLSQMRSLVIERFIAIEGLMAVTICQHYFGKVPKAFLLDVLLDEQFSFGLKRRILFKIAPLLKVQIESDIGRLNTIRNYFAHVGVGILDTAKPGQPARFPDPRDPTKSVDFTKLHDSFTSLEEPVLKALRAHLLKIGGSLVPVLTP
jgi:hypothetical protein